MEHQQKVTYDFVRVRLRRSSRVWAPPAAHAATRDSATAAQAQRSGHVSAVAESASGRPRARRDHLHVGVAHGGDSQSGSRPNRAPW